MQVCECHNPFLLGKVNQNHLMVNGSPPPMGALYGICMDTYVESPGAGTDRTNHRKVHVAQSPTKRYKIGVKGRW